MGRYHSCSGRAASNVAGVPFHRPHRISTDRPQAGKTPIRRKKAAFGRSGRRQVAQKSPFGAPPQFWAAGVAPKPMCRLGKPNRGRRVLGPSIAGNDDCRSGLSGGSRSIDPFTPERHRASVGVQAVTVHLINYRIAASRRGGEFEAANVRIAVSELGRRVPIAGGPGDK